MSEPESSVGPVNDAEKATTRKQPPPFVRPISKVKFICAIIAQSFIGILFGVYMLPFSTAKAKHHYLLTTPTRS